MIREDKIKLAIEKGFTYNPETGNIYGVRGNLMKLKQIGGYIELTIRVEKKNYRFFGHHFAWYYTYGCMPDKYIDHINGVRDDNRISNLRDVSLQHNNWNQIKAKGYYWNKRNQKWQAQIRIDGKHIHLGLFDTEIEAHKSYLDSKKIYHMIPRKQYTVNDE
jgi:hypothetical protein